MPRVARRLITMIAILVVAIVVDIQNGGVVVANEQDNKCDVAKAQNGQNPQSAQNGSTSPVARACAEGGFAAARRKMKAMVNTAKRNGVRFECASCHQPNDYAVLKSDARENFKKLLAAAPQ